MENKSIYFALRSFSLYLFLGLLSTLPVSLPAQVYTGDLSLDSQVAVDAFSYTEVTGELYISGPGINNLNSLSSLTSVGGNLWIDNISLTHLEGLSSLTSVGVGLGIWSNAALIDLDGLASLTSVGEDVSINNNTALTNLDGLSGISSVGGFLDISYNAALINLDGLSAITSVAKGLHIDNNAALAHLDGLSSLTSVGMNESWWQDGSLRISGNPGLTHLDGLSALTTVGGLVNISDNAALTHLDGLSALTSGVQGLRVYTNPSLAGFCGLHPLLNGGWTGFVYYVTGNLDNPTVADIIAGGPCTLNPAQLIAGLLADGTLNQGQANALNSKLNNCRLNAFNNLTSAWVNAGILTQTQADNLDAAATQHCTPASRIATQQTFTLGQNYPNPTSGNTVIPFTLPASGKVSIQLYDASGKMVRNLMDEYLMEGPHKVKVNLQTLPAGTYFYKLQTGEHIETLPMVME